MATRPNHAIMRSIDFALAKGARVMSLSWGAETDSAFLGEAFRYAESKNMIILASAGNEPTGKAIYPAAYSSVIGVGALGPDGQRGRSRIWPGTRTLVARVRDPAGGLQGRSGDLCGHIDLRCLCSKPDGQLSLCRTRRPRSKRSFALSSRRIEHHRPMPFS